MKKKRKTHKATVKRFKLSAKKKISHGIQGDNHLKAHKSQAQRKRKQGTSILSSSREIKKILKLMVKK